MPIQTKHGETLDWNYSEEEPSFDDYQFFQDRPPKTRPAASPAPPSEPYVPQANVVAENEQFVFALKNAPNVLYSRSKQFGQLGVLGWTHEFSELIDAIKILAFDGNMFIATREQALLTCSEILKLNLNVRLSIITMYLSSQVARLRRFLDGETTFEDYPDPDFPLDHSQYAEWKGFNY